MRVLTALALAAALAGCGRQPPPPPAVAEQQPPPPAVAEQPPPPPAPPADPPIDCGDAIKVLDLYRANVVAADRQLTGRRIEFVLRGAVRKVGGRYAVAAECVHPVPPGTGPAVVAFVTEASLPRLESATPLHAFRLAGTCRGARDDPSSYYGFVVTVEDCEVLQLLTYRGGKWQ